MLACSHTLHLISCRLNIYVLPFEWRWTADQPQCGANKNGPNEKWTHFFTFTHVCSFQNGLNTFSFNFFLLYTFSFRFILLVGMSVGKMEIKLNSIVVQLSFSSLFIFFTIIISSPSIKCIFVQREVLIHLKSEESEKEKRWKCWEISNCNLLLGHYGKFMVTFIFIQLA